MKKSMRKRLIGLFLICCMAFVMVACGKASDSKYVGTWNLKEGQASGVTVSKETVKKALGTTTEISIELKSNGKANVSFGEQNGEGTWEETDTGIKLKDSTDTMEFKEEDENLAVEVSGVKLIFEKAE